MRVTSTLINTEPVCNYCDPEDPKPVRFVDGPETFPPQLCFVHAVEKLRGDDPEDKALARKVLIVKGGLPSTTPRARPQ
jgi:hypothetical protein